MQCGKWKCTWGVALEPAVVLRFVGVEIVADDMDLSPRMRGDDGFMKARNATRRLECLARTSPLAMSRAANNAVVPACPHGTGR